MKKIITFEWNRFKRERVFLFTLLLIGLSLYLSFQGVKVYKDYQKDVIAPFQEKESELFKTINNYQLYLIRGFKTLIQPSCAAVSINPNAYELVTKSNIDLSLDNRLIKSLSNKKAISIPFLLILMVCGLYYGASVIFSTSSKIESVFIRMAFLIVAVLLIISPRFIALFFVPSTLQDFKVSLTYWGLVVLFVSISYLIGVTAKLYKISKSIITFSFILFLTLTYVSTSFITPVKMDKDWKIQVAKFKELVDFQTKEDKRFIGIEDKEKIRSIRMSIVEAFVADVYPQMIKDQRKYIGTVKTADMKLADLSLISPLDYDYLFRDSGSNGDLYGFALNIVDLEFDFLKYAWSQLYSPDKPPVIQFEGSKENTYQSKAILPHNFWLGAFIYSSIFILISGFVFFKLTRKPVPLEELKMRPGFLYREEMPDDIRARVKANAIAHGYFCIDDESIASYPGELTFSEIFSLNFYTKELLTEKVGDFFNTKLKNLEKSDLVTSLILLAVLTFDKVVIDNIGSSYSIKVKRKITYLVDELKSKGQIILYLSNSRTTLNISDPPDVKEVRFRDRFLPVETEYDLI